MRLAKLGISWFSDLALPSLQGYISIYRIASLLHLLNLWSRIINVLCLTLLRLLNSLATHRTATFLILLSPEVLNTHLRCAELVCGIPVRGYKVYTQSISPCTDEKAQRYHHCQCSTIMRISSRSQNRWHDRPSADATNNHARTAFAVLAEPSHAQGNDSRKANGFKKECAVEHRYAGIAALSDRRCNEDYAHRYVEEEDFSWADESH